MNAEEPMEKFKEYTDSEKLTFTNKTPINTQKQETIIDI